MPSSPTSTPARLWWGARAPLICTLLALLVTVFGGLLRLDALVGKYGTVDHPAWVRVVTHDIAPIGAAVRPSGINWTREARPYVGGDPINYLKYAREMQGFYQAHVREPVFLAVTRAFLWALDGQDVAVSFASLAGSTLAVFATYLLGAALVSRPAGLVAALLMALEYEAITWAPDGWRDDTFTATVLLAAWALVRLRQQPTGAHAVLAGMLGGIACLTRITALSFIVPALLWLIVSRSDIPRRARPRLAGMAMGALAVVVAPYLISCALATGDPFYAINYHTMYYRHAEGRPIAEPISAAHYLRTKVVERPIVTLDTALNGLFLQPFVTKWNGFWPWLGGLGTVLSTLAVIGLCGWALFPTGRFLLVVLFASLAPYMLTWNVGGGNEWRFTMHAYPFYLVAAASVVIWTARVAVRLPTTRLDLRDPAVKALAIRGAALALVAALGVAAYYVLPWFVVREGIARGDSTSIETGDRDRLFFAGGWSPPHADGITIRVSRGERSTVRVPLSPGRDYDIVLRLDPIDPAAQRRVNVLLNGTLIGAPTLAWDPQRVGSYSVRVHAQRIRAMNELTILPDVLVTAGSAGPRFSWLDADDRIGLRLWYLRVLPR